MALVNCKECGNEVSKTAKTCPKCGAAVAQSYGCGTLILVVFVVMILASLFSSPSGTPTSSSSGPSPSEVKNLVMAKMDLKKLHWNKGGFDNVMILNTTLVNGSDHDVKDVEITCDHFSNSGTKIDSNKRTIYEIVKAGKSRRVNDFNMGIIHSQAASTNCSVTDLVVQ
jgi:hypothetical protein